MDYTDVACKIIAIKDADLHLRATLVRNGELGKGYNEAMEQLHNQNAEILNGIIDEIGYPTKSKVGSEATEAAWLVIQHSVGRPDFMKKCLELLKDAVAQNEANPLNLAYLSDRIATMERRPQLYGTQFDWDENGQLSPQPYDNLANVNQRRKAIGLKTLEEQTELMRKQATAENESPPKDFEKRKQQIEDWKRATGWIK